MKLKKMHWIGIIFGAIVIVLSGVLFYEDLNLLIFLVGIGVASIALPFVVGIVLEGKKTENIDKMFLEFSRSLAESVSSGTPISKSIINMKNKAYGDLSPHIMKLANQIELGIPVERALTTFSNEVNSPVIRRAVSLIKEAQKAGGDIDFILDSVAKSISEVDKLQKERKAAISNLVVQGYIIFFIFIGIILVMQFKILPITEDIGSFGFVGTDVASLQQGNLQTGGGQDVQGIGRSFLYLLLAQGLFAGLTIGKLSEGSIRAGVKHSFILTIAAFLISTGANLFLG